MPNQSFGGAGGTAFTGFFPLTSTPIPLASGRAMASGSTAVLPVNLSLLLGGNGGARTAGYSLGGASGSVSIASGSAASRLGSLGGALFNGGTGTLSITASGSINFGRAGSGTTTDGHTAFGNVIGGSYDYVQAPPAMAAPTLSASAGAIVAAFTPPSDAGDGTISGYVVQYSTDPTFATSSTATAASSPATITVAPGLYYVRVSSDNQATVAAGSHAAWSTAASIHAGIGGHRWDGTAEQPFTTAVRWDGSAEIPLTVAVRWNGTAEVAIS